MKTILPALGIIAVFAASPLVAQDARAVIDAASNAMGTGNLQTRSRGWSRRQTGEGRTNP